MFCGPRSFSQIDGRSGGESPTTSKKKLKQLSSSSHQLHKGSRKHTNNSKNNNPYSSTGLDKFEKVLAELEAKKESILSRAKSQGGKATVRFTYRSETEDWIPIIIKRREEKTDDEGETKMTRVNKGVAAKRLSVPPSFKIDKGLEDDDKVVMKKRKGNKNKKNMKSRCYYSWGGGWYWALVVVLVLVALIFGRSFAICWTTMWWYMVPMVKERMGINLRRKELSVNKLIRR